MQKGASGDGGDRPAGDDERSRSICASTRDGGVLIADTENHVIRKYSPADGKITRIAGSGKRGTAGVGGPALEVEINQPHGVYVHASGDSTFRMRRTSGY